MNPMIPDYHFNDRRLGDVVIINGKDAYREYNADLVSDEESPGVLYNNNIVHPLNTGFLYNVQDSDPVVHSWTFYVGGETKTEAEMNVARLINECKECTIEQEDIPFKYIAVMNGYTTENTGVDYFYMVTISCDVLKQGEIFEKEITGSDLVPGPFNYTHLYKFNNPGLVPSGIRIEYEWPSSQTGDTEHSINISDENLYTLRVSAGTSLDINGMAGYITGTNLSNTIRQFTNFLKAKPGDNEILFHYLSTDDLNNKRIKLSYAAMY